MNIDYLKTFFHVAEIKSFTQAAKDLHLTQPAVSQQIQNIENSLGVKLFERGHGKVKLSAEGAVLFSYVQKIFETIRELEDAFRDLHGLRMGHLSIGATAIMGTYYLPTYISAFHKLYPNLKLNVCIKNSHLISEMMYQGSIDLAFGGSSAMHQELARQFLHREPLVVVARRDSPLLRKPMLSAEDLADETFVIRERGARITGKVMDWFRRNNVKSELSLMIVNNMEAAKALVAHGAGLGVLPKHAVEACEGKNSLAILPLENFDLHTDYFLLYSTTRKLSIPAQAFLGLMYSSGVALPEDLIATSNGDA